MRDNVMFPSPSSPSDSPFSPEPVVPGGATVAESVIAGFLRDESRPNSVIWGIGLSVFLHIAVVLGLWLILMLLQFLGINLTPFTRPEQLKDLEFQLVNAPVEAPRNPNTHNRAEHNTRSGGQKIPNVHEAQSQSQAGNRQNQPRKNPAPPQKQIANPQPARPHQTQPHPPTPQKSTSQTPPRKSINPDTNPIPPSPRMTAPKAAPTRQHIAALPNPLAPIHVPDSQTAANQTGPVVRGPAGGSATGSRNGTGHALGPATVPGQFSHGGQANSGGGLSGHGGRGSYSNYGSPGGGGGRSGVDALAEPDFGPYLSELQRRIRRNWHPPEDRADKTVILVFTISKDGRLLSIATRRSSGYSSADGAARDAVENSAPFRPLPAEFRQNHIQVEFTFDYNVFMGRGGGIRR